MKKNNIFIIDNNLVTILGLKSILEYQYNCKVYFTLQKKEIFDLLKNQKIELIIIDLFQNKKFDFELYKEIMILRSKNKILFYSDFEKYKKPKEIRKKNCFNFDKNESIVNLLKILDTLLVKSENVNINTLFNKKNNTLIKREQKINLLLLSGLNDSEICKELEISNLYLESVKNRLTIKSNINKTIEFNDLTSYIQPGLSVIKKSKY